MSLSDLYKKQNQEKKDYNALRDKTWREIKERHENLVEAFQTKENLPSGYADEMEKEINDYNSEWSIPDGTRYKNLLLQQEQQIKAVTDFLTPLKEQDDFIINDNVVEQKQDSFMDKLASSRVLKEEEEQRLHEQPEISRNKSYQQNKDDMEID